MNPFNLTNAAMTIAATYFLYAALSANILLSIVFILALAVFAASMYAQHKHNGTTYRATADRYLFLQLVTIVAIVGIVLATAGRFLV